MRKFCKLIDNHLPTIIILVLVLVLMMVLLSACQTEAEMVSYNLSLEADNFNDVRQLTVINCIQGDVLFQMTGRMSIEVDELDHQLEIVVEDEYGQYSKHFIGLSDNVTYVLEDINADNVEKYKYTLNFNPNMWIPIEASYVD